jgi:glycosyltransferase involved in cell wall biosynthesis
MLTSIIIPAYNEEKYIRECLEETIRVFNDAKIDYEIIVAADGCTDDTVKIASEYLPQEKILISEERLGKGGGVMEASRLASGSHILIMDVDLSAHPKSYFDLVRENADVVIGTRSKESYPWYRWFLSRAFNLLFRFMFKLRLHDTQCGFKLVRREVFEDIRDCFKTGGFAYDVELLMRAHKKGYKIVEVPISYLHNTDSKVKTLRQSFEMGLDLARIWYYLNVGVG